MVHIFKIPATTPYKALQHLPPVEALLESATVASNCEGSKGKSAKRKKNKEKVMEQCWEGGGTHVAKGFA